VADSSSTLNIVVTRKRQRQSVFGSVHQSAAPCCKFITSKSALPTATTTTRKNSLLLTGLQALHIHRSNMDASAVTFAACPYKVIIVFFRKDRLDMQGGSVCIFIKNATVKAVRVDIDINYNEFDLVCIDIFSSCLPTRIIAGYRHPSSDTSAEPLVHQTFRRLFNIIM